MRTFHIRQDVVGDVAKRPVQCSQRSRDVERGQPVIAVQQFRPGDQRQGVQNLAFRWEGSAGR